MRNLENWSQLTPIRDCTELPISPMGFPRPQLFFRKHRRHLEGDSHGSGTGGRYFGVRQVEDVNHVRNLDSVLKRLSDAGLKLKRQKCKFMQPSVGYLGYLIDKEGIDPMARKVEAICDAPAPSNITELCSLLGMTQYYAKFIKGYSTLTNPLNILPRKGSVWK